MNNFGEKLAQLAAVQELIRLGIEEDIGAGDVTSESIIDGAVPGAAVIKAKQRCTLSGGIIAREVFRHINPCVEVTLSVPDGTELEVGEVALTLKGPVGSLLAGERLALNFLQRLSGVATLTRRYVDAVKQYGTLILDTRKTTPGWRALEKYAVTCGGGTNHRMGLYDRVMIKDNHLQYWCHDGEGDLAEAARVARRQHPQLVIEVEADTVDQVRHILPGKPDWILLDNMSLDDLCTCVALCRGKCRTEASGGVTLATLEPIAATGVDAISVGALTHSAVAVDLSMELR